ncbi:MAG: DNA translocase FtsK 4TM domain-containing protein [Vallitaleaceae bacterium]|nr:DNA translocase FtsK 4TM domain-containing protein [Vallitaleaceae bacterium]
MSPSKPGRPSNASKRPVNQKTAPKRTYTKKATQARSEKVSLLKYEIVVMSFVTLALLLILSVYFGLGGAFGSFIRTTFFGVLGVGAYLVPAFIFGASVFKIFNNKNERLNNKIILLFLWILAISTFAHVLYIRSSQINENIMGESAFFPTLLNYFSISSHYRVGGGFVGGFFGDLFALLLGKIGSIIILSLINLAIIILLTEQSLFALIKIIGLWFHKISASAVEKSKDVVATTNEQMKNRKLQKAEEEDLYLKNIEQGELAAKEKGNLLNKSTLGDLDGVQEKRGWSPFESHSEIIPDAPQEVMPEPIPVPVQEASIQSLSDQPKENVQISFFKDKKAAAEKSDIIDKDFIKKEAQPLINKSLYEYPPLQLLQDNPFVGVRGSREALQKNAEKLEQTLESFGVLAKVINISCGPSVTRYELQPEQGVKVSRIVNLSDDIALNLAASGIRMEAPIPGKSLIGIEVPNKEVSSVFIKEVIDTVEFKKFPSKIAFALGKDISGETIIADIARMPHMLISGSTGSGKSVCINTLITSILFRANPNEVKLLMIDPKVVELKVYNGIPHLLIPVVTDPKKAASALYWAVQEMSERYQLFANANVRDLGGYNRMVDETGELNKLPQIVIIVDELADLMQVASKEVEDAICRLAQMARAAGIHLILATQRPSVDVITGLIKANIPSRIAFAVSSGIDSRTIIDMNGAEKLVGKGDMLYFPTGMSKPIRVQGDFISDKEVERVVDFLKASQKVHYDKALLDQISKDPKANDNGDKSEESAHDSLFEDALELVIDQQKASASMIQRRFRVGYNRAARIVDQLHEAGFIGPEEGSKPRRVNITLDEYHRLKQDSGIEEALATYEEEDENF